MKAQYYGSLDLTFVDGNSWVMNQADGHPFGVRIETDEEAYKIQPPHKFVTDLLSIPVCARWIIPKTGGNDKSGRAAIAHDWLYTMPGANHTPANRLFADMVFKACLQADKVAFWKTTLMYTAVRVGGGRCYGDKMKLKVLRGIK